MYVVVVPFIMGWAAYKTDVSRRPPNPETDLLRCAGRLDVDCGILGPYRFPGEEEGRYHVREVKGKCREASRDQAVRRAAVHIIDEETRVKFKDMKENRAAASMP